MSLITCCPACGTMFRVVPDQLKISEGWVRCGHCAEVFDATAHMVAEPPPPAPAPPETDTQPADDLTSVAPDTPGAAAIPGPTVTESDLRESELDQPFVFRRSDLGRSEGPASEPSSVPESVPPPSRPSRAGPEEDDEPSHEDVSFIRQARRQAFWQRPAMRGVLVLLVLLLAVLLAAQYAVQERDRLAAAQPELHPLLDRLCEFAGCRVEPVRDIEAVAIDNSAFNKLRTDAYRLSFTLKNNSTLPVAVPAMELTLTDGQDVPLLRRVLLPSDLGAQSPTIGAGADWSTSVAIAVNSAEQGPRVAGYRLLAFYP